MSMGAMKTIVRTYKNNYWVNNNIASEGIYLRPA